MEKEKPVIKYNSVGESGNIYYIFGKVKEIVGDEIFNQIFKEIKEKGYDYYESLELMGKYVILIDSPNVR